MRRQTITTVTTYMLLLLAGAAPFTMPRELGGSEAPLMATAMHPSSQTASVAAGRVLRTETFSSDVHDRMLTARGVFEGQ